MYESELNKKYEPMNENSGVRGPKPLPSRAKIKMLDDVRYQMMLDAAWNLSSFLKEYMEEGEVIAEVQEPHNTGVVTTEVDSLLIQDVRAFTAIFAGADRLELRQAENGKLRLSVVFHSVLLPVQWVDKDC